MRYSYNRSSHTASTFFVKKFRVDIDVDLYPGNFEWTPSGKILMSGKATFLLPHFKYISHPYELETEEDGKVLKCRCPDELQRRLIWLAAEGIQKELADLIKDEKVRGTLVKKPQPT